MYIDSQSPEHWSSTTLLSDKTLNTYSSETDQKNSPEKEQMVKDIYMCYGGAGAAFAGTPTTFCQSSSSHYVPTKTRSNNNEIDIKQIYLGSITVVGLFVLFRILQKSY